MVKIIFSMKLFLSILSRNTGFVAKYGFCREIRVLSRNTGFVVKYGFCREIRVLSQNTGFVAKYGFSNYTHFYNF